MTDRWDDFDCALAASLSELPLPEKTVRTVTPFRAAMERITLGLCLTCFTLHIWYLDYLLPALGTMALYLGFRTLRRNNCWFRIGWFLNICKVIILYFSFVLQAIPPGSWILWFSTPQVLLNICFTLALFLCLWQGLAGAAAEVGRPRKAALPALWALVWYAVLAALAFLWPSPGWAVFLVMLYAFYRIVRSLLRLGTLLTDWGYAVRAAPVKLGTGRLTALYLLSLTVLVVAFALASNHLPVEGKQIEQKFESPDIFSIREDLSGFFPRELLDRLPEEELEKLSTWDYCYSIPYVNQQDEDSGIRLDTVFVRIGPCTLRVYQFFTQETSLLTPWLGNRLQWQCDSSGTVSDMVCQLQWNQGDTPFAADLRIETERFFSYFGEQQTQYTAVFSYPLRSSAHQGWAAYTITYPGENFDSSLYTHYTLQSLRSLYPRQENWTGADTFARSYLTMLPGPYDAEKS